MSAQAMKSAGHDDEYYSHVRGEIAQLLPDRVGRILEIGCGEGETLAWIKAERQAGFVYGVELSAASADRAAVKLDRVVAGNFETMVLPPDCQAFDVILCLDVLEQLQELVGRSNRMLASDLAIAAILAEAAIRAAAWNVRINLPQVSDAATGAKYQAEMDAALERAHTLAVDIERSCG